MNRTNILLVIDVFLSILLFGCSNKQGKNGTSLNVEEKAPFFKLFLAQWQLRRAIGNKDISPLDFAQIANKLGFEGIEFVGSTMPEKEDIIATENLLLTAARKLN